MSIESLCAIVMATTIVEDTSPALIWSSPPTPITACPLADWPWCPTGWVLRPRNAAGRFTNGTVTTSSDLAASVALSFRGSSIALTSTLDFEHCLPLLITLDGQSVSVDCTRLGNGVAYGAVVFSQSGLDPLAQHLIVVRGDPRRRPNYPCAPHAVRELADTGQTPRSTSINLSCAWAKCVSSLTAQVSAPVQITAARTPLIALPSATVSLVTSVAPSLGFSTPSVASTTTSIARAVSVVLSTSARLSASPIVSTSAAQASPAVRASLPTQTTLLAVLILATTALLAAIVYCGIRVRRRSRSAAPNTELDLLATDILPDDKRQLSFLYEPTSVDVTTTAWTASSRPTSQPTIDSSALNESHVVAITLPSDRPRTSMRSFGDTLFGTNAGRGR